jgi:hypothetical protein
LGHSLPCQSAWRKSTPSRLTVTFLDALSVGNTFDAFLAPATDPDPQGVAPPNPAPQTASRHGHALQPPAGQVLGALAPPRCATLESACWGSGEVCKRIASRRSVACNVTCACNAVYRPSARTSLPPIPYSGVCGAQLQKCSPWRRAAESSWKEAMVTEVPMRRTAARAGAGAYHTCRRWTCLAAGAALALTPPAPLRHYV